jgi:hypothetical protein
MTRIRSSSLPQAGQHENASVQRPQYDVFVSRGIEAGKNFYTKIGSAWNVAKDGISITLDATPVDGRMVLFPVKKED